MKNHLLLTSLVLLSFSSCTKDKLEGAADALSGKWRWIMTSGEFGKATPASTGKTKFLEFKDKGKYEVQEDGDRIEAGRITYIELTGLQGTLLRINFLRNTLFSRQREFPGESILSLGNDTLQISQDAFDVPFHTYVRES